MGIWGIGPFDTDRASDMIAGLMKPIRLAATRKSDHSAQYHYEEARCAAQLVLVAHGHDILGGASLETVLRALVRIRNDHDWVGGRRHSGPYRRALDQEIDAVLARLDTCKGCRRGHRPKTLTQFHAFVAAARAEPLPPKRAPARAKRQRTTSARAPA